MLDESERESYHGHPEVIERMLNSRVHDDKPVLQCERCGFTVDRDSPDEFANADCDHYKTVRDGIMGGLNES